MNRVGIFLILSFLLCRCSSNLNEDDGRFAEMGCYPSVDDVYEYPKAQPGETTDDVKKKMQIPGTVLKQMSTYSLIQSIPDNPLLSLIPVSSDRIVPSAHAVFSQMNCIEELERRPDCESIVSFYREIDYPCICSQIRKSEKYEISYDPSRMYFFELLFTKPEIINRISPAMQRELISELLHKYEQKLEYSEIMGGPLCLSSFLAVAWILYTNAYTPVVDLHNSDPEFRDAMFAGNFSSEHQEKILSFAKSFINKY